MIDYDTAATKAAETLMKYGVRTFPVSALQILEQMENVIVITFDDMCISSGVRLFDLTVLMNVNQDAFTVFREGRYIVAYNSILPFALVQRALAREMGHIILRHKESSPENTEEALCFARHLLCPRPLLHAIRVTNLRITTDLLANLTGVFDRELIRMRHTPGTKVPARLNHFVRQQFSPFVMNFFGFFRHTVPDDGSALADLGTYMDGYEE